MLRRACPAKAHSGQTKEYFNSENYYNYLVYKQISFSSLKKGGETFIPKTHKLTAMRKSGEPPVFNRKKMILF